MLCNTESLLEQGYELHATRHRASGWRRCDGGFLIIEVPYEEALSTVQALQGDYYVRTTPTARVLTPEPLETVPASSEWSRPSQSADPTKYVLGDTHMTLRSVADALDATLGDVCRLIRSDYLETECFDRADGGEQRLVVYDANLHYLIEERRSRHV